MDAEKKVVQLTLEEALAEARRRALRPDFSGPPVFKPPIGIAKSPLLIDQRDSVFKYLGCPALPAGVIKPRR